MATITVTATPSFNSLTISGTTPSSGTITWVAPTIPSGTVISSCVLSGTLAKTMSKGSSTVKINGTTITTNTFSINLDTSNATTSVTVTAIGGNKNAGGTVSISDVSYTVTYKIPISSISLDSTASVKVGDTITLQAILNPSDADNYNLDWQTDNENVTILGNGTSCTVTGDKKGASVVTISDSVSGQTASCTVTVTPPDYKVTFKNYDGSVVHSYTASATSTFTVPDDPVRDGYIFSHWSHAELGEFTKSQLEEKSPELLGANGDVEFTAVYSVKTYTVRFLDWNNDVLDTQTINHGSNAIPPNDPIRDGYRFTGWSGTYTNITANTDIIAQYIKTYNIVASAGTGGTISPSGTITVDEGVSQSYTISVNTEYRIKDVLVDGVSQGAIVSYTFSNVSADHTISVNFEAVPTYTITTNIGEGGSISPSGNIILTEGDSRTFTFIPDSGYGIKDVLVDDISQGEITSYTFTDVTANHTLSVIFKKIPRVIAAIKKNVFYAINIFEGYNNFSIGADGVYLNAIHEDLNENENIYLDSNGILHVYKFIKGNL